VSKENFWRTLDTALFGDAAVVCKKIFWNLLFLLPALVTRLLFNSKRVMTTFFKGEFALNGLDRSISSQFNNVNGFFWKWEGTTASASPIPSDWSCFLAGLEFWSNPIYPIFVG
jgi:hypothetical protein